MIFIQRKRHSQNFSYTFRLFTNLLRTLKICKESKYVTEVLRMSYKVNHKKLEKNFWSTLTQLVITCNLLRRFYLIYKLRRVLTVRYTGKFIISSLWLQ